jgi:hypothetical protein
VAVEANFTEFPTEQHEQPDQQMDHDSDEAEENNDIDLNMKPRAKRNTQLFAKKMLLGKLDLFLDSTLYGDKYSDNSIENLTGQVLQCPRSSNGRMYRIDWKEPLPLGLDRSWLHSHIAASRGRTKPNYSWGLRHISIGLHRQWQNLLQRKKSAH